MDKVPIELSPYDALQILTFMTEMKSSMNHPHFDSLKESFKNYSDEVYIKIRIDQIEDAEAERAVNQLLNKEPV